MLANVSFHNVDHSESLEHFIQEKSRGLNRFLGDSERLSWVINSEAKVFSPHLELVLNGQSKMIKSEDENVFRAVANVSLKAHRLLSDRHGRRNHSNRKAA